MNTPCIEQAWAGDYLSVAVSILVFGLGVPALILQTMVSENVRDVARRRWQGGRWAQLLVLLSLLIALCMVWLVPQCDPSIARVHDVFGGHINVLIADLMISMAILGVAAIWWVQASYRSERMIAHVERLCRRQIEREGRIEPGLIHDIVSLSGEDKTSRQRVRVICTLKDLAKTLSRHPKYDEGGMTDIVRGIETIAAVDGEPTLIEALRAFHSIMDGLPRPVATAADVEHIVAALTRLQSFAAASISPHPLRLLLGVLEAVQSKPAASLVPSIALASLGIEALADKRGVVAVEALMTLESITWPAQPLRGEEAAGYLGLVAHFWQRGGAARARALTSIEELAFAPDVQTSFESASVVHERATRFDTADLLREMAQNEREFLARCTLSVGHPSSRGGPIGPGGFEAVDCAPRLNEREHDSLPQRAATEPPE